jgi:hypothetical protein
MYPRKNEVAPARCNAVVLDKRRFMVPVMVFCTEGQVQALQTAREQRRPFHMRPFVKLTGPHPVTANGPQKGRRQPAPFRAQWKKKGNQEIGHAEKCGIAIGSKNFAFEHVQRVSMMVSKRADEA